MGIQTVLALLLFLCQSKRRLLLQILKRVVIEGSTRQLEGHGKHIERLGYSHERKLNNISLWRNETHGKRAAKIVSIAIVE
jgi:hypothetical protein